MHIFLLFINLVGSFHLGPPKNTPGSTTCQNGLKMSEMDIPPFYLGPPQIISGSETCQNGFKMSEMFFSQEIFSYSCEPHSVREINIIIVTLYFNFFRNNLIKFYIAITDGLVTYKLRCAF